MVVTIVVLAVVPIVVAVVVAVVLKTKFCGVDSDLKHTDNSNLALSVLTTSYSVCIHQFLFAFLTRLNSLCK